jgi:hypothetical protein
MSDVAQSAISRLQPLGIEVAQDTSRTALLHNGFLVDNGDLMLRQILLYFP